MLHVRMDEDTKAEAIEVLAAMGQSTSDAVRPLFHRIIADQAFPLALKVPNAETWAAMAGVDRTIADKRACFTDGGASIADLGD